MKPISIILIVVIGLIMPCFATAEDRSERLSQESSYTFSPGYINAARYQADSFLKVNMPEYKKKGVLENALEYVKDKLGNNTREEQAKNAVLNPELQRKTSVGGKSAGLSSAIVLAASNTNPAEIPAAVRSAIEEYVTNNSDTLKSGYKVSSSNGKYYVFWDSIDANYNTSVKGQIFGSDGTALNSSPINITNEGLYLYDVSALANGNVMVFWGEHDADWNGSLKAEIFDADGNGSATINLTGSNLLAGDQIYNVSTLANGNIAVFWGEYDASYNNSLKTQIFGSSGNALFSSPISVVTNDPDVTYNLQIYNVSTFANGNVAVFWGQGTGESSGYFLKSEVFDTTGNILCSSPVMLSNTSTDLYKVTNLANGNIAVFWKEDDGSWNQTLKTQIFRSDGTYNAPVTLTSDSPSLEIYNVSTLVNGNIAVVWKETGAGTSYLRTQLFDSNGAALYGSPIELASSVGGSIVVDNISTFANGNVAVFWKEADRNYHYSFKAQMFDSIGTKIYSTPLTVSDAYAVLYGATTLANGDVALFWREADASWNQHVKIQVFDANGNAKYALPVVITGNSILRDAQINSVTTLANGNVVVVWLEFDSNYNGFLKAQMFDSTGTAVFSTSVTLSGDFAGGTTYKIVSLANGNIAVSWWDYDRNLKAQIFDPSGNTLNADPITIGGAYFAGGADLYDISTLSDGSIAVFWKAYDANFDYTLQSKIIGSTGSLMSTAALRPSSQDTSYRDFVNSVLSPFNNMFGMDAINDVFMYNPKASTLASGNDTSNILAGLLANKDALNASQGQISPELIAKMLADFRAASVALPGAEVSPQDMEVAMRLASILANPTDDQKAMIDVMSSLLTEMDNVEGKAGANPELKKATDELLQAVANVLLAQAIPDLLKEGDLSNIKGIFSNLDSAKTKVILEYNESTKPYYDEVKKILQRNAEALQLSNLLQKNILQKEMEELPRSEIDKIIDKLKSKEKKTTEEEYILQQAAKYKEKYVDPNKKKLEEDMKVTLQDFTKKLSITLETTKK